MVKFDSLGKVARAVNTAVKSGARKAANIAAKAAKEEMITQVKAETGFPASYVNDRVRSFNATAKIPQAKVYATFRKKISLSNDIFKPKEKAIRVRVTKAYTKHGVVKKPYKATYYGATVKIGKNPRELVPGGFLRGISGKKKNGDSYHNEFIFSRSGKGRTPIEVQANDLYMKAVKKSHAKTAKVMKAVFNDNMGSCIAQALSKATGNENE